MRVSINKIAVIGWTFGRKVNKNRPTTQAAVSKAKKAMRRAVKKADMWCFEEFRSLIR